MSSCQNRHMHSPERADGKPHRDRRRTPPPIFGGRVDSAPPFGAGAAVSRSKGQKGHPLPHKSASAGRFKLLSWTTRHNRRLPWGNFFASMGGCGLSAYGLKHFYPGGGLAVGPCAPAPVPTHAQGCWDLCGNIRQKTARFSANPQALADFIPLPQPHAQARRLRPRNACVTWARILVPVPRIYPPFRVFASSETLLPAGPRLEPLLPQCIGGCCAPGHGTTLGITPSPGSIPTTVSCLHCRQNNTSPCALVASVSRSSFPRRHTGHTTHAPPMVVLQASSAAVLLMLSSPDSFSHARRRPRV